MTPSIVAPLLDFEARILSVLGHIGPPEINLVIDQLLRLDHASDAPITVFIGSRGGDVVEALKLLDTLGLLRARITAVGMGLIEGASIFLLAGAQQRILYPSTAASVAGLWDLPQLHASAKRGMGLHLEAPAAEQLRTQITQRLKEVVGAGQGKIPELLADPAVPVNYYTASDLIRLGFADAVINGPHRLLIKPSAQINLHAKNKITPCL
jgi:ATP-dependent protease ClpP protease subunit